MTEARYILRSAAIVERACKAIRALPLSRLHQVDIMPCKRVRSLEQNRRYWALLKILALEMARQMDGEYHAPDVWHEWAKAEFLGKNTLVIDGEPHLVQKSTTKLTVMEFLDFTEQVEAFAAEHGIILGEE